MAEDGRRGDEGERGPGALYQMFVTMEDLLDKLKLMNYEESLIRKNNMKPLSRCVAVLPLDTGAGILAHCTPQTRLE